MKNLQRHRRVALQLLIIAVGLRQAVLTSGASEKSASIAPFALLRTRHGFH
jgi:hypothetical protein